MGYSPFTYSVAVAMLEMFTGKTFDAMLEEEVFGPLGASECGLGPTTLDQSLPPSQTWSHFSGPWGVYNIPILPGNSNMQGGMRQMVGMNKILEYVESHIQQTYGISIGVKTCKLCIPFCKKYCIALNSLF